MLKLCLFAAALVGVCQSDLIIKPNNAWKATESMLTSLGQVDSHLARTVRDNDRNSKHIFSIIAVLMLRIVSPTNKRLREVDLANDPVDVIASEPVRQLDLLRTTLAPAVLVEKQARVAATDMAYVDVFHYYHEKQTQLCPAIKNHDTLLWRTQRLVNHKVAQRCLRLAIAASLIKPTPERPALAIANEFVETQAKNEEMCPSLIANMTEWFQEFLTTNYRCNLAQPK